MEYKEDPMPMPQHKTDRPVYDPEWSRKMEDPEFAWRQRYKQDPSLNGSSPVMGDNNGPYPSSPKTIWIKLLLSVLIFAGIWGMFHVNQPWADNGRQLVAAALTQAMDARAITAWYADKFGDSPSFIPSFRNRDNNPAVKVSSEKRTYFIPVQGKIRQPFDASHSGIILQTQADAPVYALDTGQVIFSGLKEDTGFTVIIRHPLGFQSLYGRLSDSRVEVNDWIKGGEPIGKVSMEEVSSGSLYFAMIKEGRFINPRDVIPFD
jgi:stage IV sporulation protein FA